ncbi:MAG: DUF1801 domain-containing protein [Gammaproteobacteria bacterium]|jgi:hypothetical protein|nr:DUF1801 domain-containing protein [Gammaproteobacteria bacterium]MBU1506330.1 DUF1801 domain-containing protein [Gammaproteobacteria bacterium]MBU2123391.1 DUF1801 domain-containing protein [Gammaproteobacteria bacterium]MBU2169274.1 DUF1801 domain-containing protein [Gammaproteobacteria bacterium]MBU2201425.1 DUF1801 domain-containing protein [Gammaproteobacteria bacterium]
MTPFASATVAAKFAAYPPHVRAKLLALRELVFETAATAEGVGDIEESLKWGEPAYATKNKSGSTVRMDWKQQHPHQYAMYFNCQTTLIETFRTIFPTDFKFDGNRALVFSLEEEVPKIGLAMCIAASFTYHLKKKAAKAPKGSR